MRISDLSRQTQVPVATIKFYLREGLLTPGVPTARNQASYGEPHVARLRIIRILKTVGGLSLSSVREVLSAIDGKGLTLRAQCEVVNNALFADQASLAEHEITEAARLRVYDFLTGLGWQTEPDSPGVTTLTRVLDALQRLGLDVDVEMFEPHAHAVSQVAVHECDAIAGGPPAAHAAGTVLLEVALVALRRMVQQQMVVAADPPVSAWA